MTSSDVETVSVSRPTGSVTAETTAMMEVMKLIVVSINLFHSPWAKCFWFLGTLSNDVLSDVAICSQY